MFDRNPNIGRVSGRALVRGRASTRTDFALVAPVIDDVLRSMPLKGLSERLQEALKGLRLRFSRKGSGRFEFVVKQFSFHDISNQFFR